APACHPDNCRDRERSHRTAASRTVIPWDASWLLARGVCPIDRQRRDWFPVVYLRRIYQMPQQRNEFGTRNRPGAERSQMRGLLLAVYHRNAAALQEANQVRQRNLRRVADAGEHRFAVEHPADADAVGAADQLAVEPNLR